jgi:tryptophanyl-tRNA synthetase
MSKSQPEGCLTLLEPLEIARKKILSAVTDPQRKRRTDPGNPEVCNIFTIHQHFTPADKIGKINVDCRNAAIGCVDCKKILLEGLLPVLQKIQDDYQRLSPETVREILAVGGRACRSIARETMENVRRLTGCYHPTSD